MVNRKRLSSAERRQIRQQAETKAFIEEAANHIKNNIYDKALILYDKVC